MAQAFTSDVEAREKDLDKVEETRDKFAGVAKVTNFKNIFKKRLQVLNVIFGRETTLANDGAGHL